MTKKDEIEEILDNFIMGNRWDFADLDEKNAVNEILEICNKPQKLNKEKYKKELLNWGVTFTKKEFQCQWKALNHILNQDVWEETE